MMRRRLGRKPKGERDKGYLKVLSICPFALDAIEMNPLVVLKGGELWIFMLFQEDQKGGFFH